MERKERNQDITKRFPLNIDMIRAGVTALEQWDHARDPEQTVVTAIFYAMLREMD